MKGKFLVRQKGNPPASCKNIFLHTVYETKQPDSNFRVSFMRGLIVPILSCNESTYHQGKFWITRMRHFLIKQNWAFMLQPSKGEFRSRPTSGFVDICGLDRSEYTMASLVRHVNRGSCGENISHNIAHADSGYRALFTDFISLDQSFVNFETFCQCNLSIDCFL